MNGRSVPDRNRLNREGWNVAIVDGEPQEVINVARVADLVRRSPLGVDEAMSRLREKLAPEMFKLVEAEVQS